MSIYKPGDKVQCINETNTKNLLRYGYVYTVKYQDSFDRGLYLEETPEAYRFQNYRFMRVIPHKNESTTLPIDSAERKNYPLFSGLLRYFPAALAGVAKTSKLGNDKHNPGEEMHHARSKSLDHGDCILRHLVDVEDLRAALNSVTSAVTQQDVLNEVNQMVWRALAFSQEIHERYGAPMAPGAKK